MTRSFCLLLLCVSMLSSAAAEAPAGDRENATYAISLENFFPLAKKNTLRKALNVYPNRVNGKWDTVLATSRDWNTGLHLVDVSKLEVKGDTLVGQVTVTLTPDPWVPKDHKPRKATVEIDAKIISPADPKYIFSLTGTWKSSFEGDAAQNEASGLVPSTGNIGGGINPTPLPPLDNVSYDLMLQQLLPGQAREEHHRRIAVSLGIREGKVISARVAPVNLRNQPDNWEAFETPSEVKLSKAGERISGTFSLPYQTLDAEPATFNITIDGQRVQGFIVGTYTAKVYIEGGKELDISGTFRGEARQGAAVDTQLVKDDRPWFVPAKGYKPLEKGEHPRLFFRRAELPELKRRAATKEGQYMIARLKALLGGGEAMPTVFNPATAAYEKNNFKPVTGNYSISHAAGFGFLYQISGDRKYADLARECVELAFKGQRNFDDRYAWVAPGGELRAGPSIGWTAVAYDLCYDAWDPAYRVKVAQAIQNYNDQKGGEWNNPENITLRAMAFTPRHGPISNHFGAVNGGSGLAVLAIKGDPGTDDAVTEKYDAALQRGAVRLLNAGFGDGGFFHEGMGPGTIGSYGSFLCYLQALRISQGRDYVNGPRANAAWISMHLAKTLVGTPPTYPHRSMMGPSYGGNDWYKERTGFSHGGQFSEGFGAIRDEQRAAFLWVYNRFVEPYPFKPTPSAPPKGKETPEEYTFDTVSLYPHRAMLALVNWPLDTAPVNPGEVVPRAHLDTHFGYAVARNRWQDNDDIVVSLYVGGPKEIKPRGVMVWGYGNTRLNWGELPLGQKITQWEADPDGSCRVSVGKSALAIDFGRKSGADAVLVLVNSSGGRLKPDKMPPRISVTELESSGNKFAVMTLAAGNPPEVKAIPDGVVAGGVEFRFDGTKLKVGGK